MSLGNICLLEENPRPNVVGMVESLIASSPAVAIISCTFQRYRVRSL
jgi:hypothetical protein